MGLTVRYDLLETADPLNATAGVVVRESAEQYAGRVPEYHAHWTAPPLPEARLPAGVEDLSGRRVGRLRVVRYHRRHPKLGSQWLVRCDCGDYELRRTKALRDTGERAMCAACDWLNVVKARNERERHGMSGREADALRLDQLAEQARAPKALPTGNSKDPCHDD